LVERGRHTFSTKVLYRKKKKREIDLRKSKSGRPGNKPSPERGGTTLKLSNAEKVSSGPNAAGKSRRSFGVSW